MCEEFGIFLGDDSRSFRRVVQCDKKPPSGTIKDCPYYRFTMEGSGHHLGGLSCWASGETGGKGAGGDYQSPSAESSYQRTGLSRCESRFKDTGSDNRSFSGGYLSRPRKVFSSQASDKSGIKGTGGSATATTSSNKGI